MAKRKKKQNRKVINRSRRQPKPSIFLPAWKHHPPFEPLLVGQNPFVEEIVELHADLCRVCRRAPFAIWEDWLKNTGSWAQLIGQIGEVESLAGLPPDVAEEFQRISKRYSRLSATYPAAYRKMGEVFTRIWRILADTYPAIDLEACTQYDNINPDILGQAFVASLGYPQAWHRCFPDWQSCVEIAPSLIPGDPLELVYEAITNACLRAGVVPPSSISDETWQEWFMAIGSDIEPIIINAATSSTMLLALAALFPRWARPFIRFTWPQLAGDTILNRICSITANLYGLNNFYSGKWMADFATIQRIKEMMEQEGRSPHQAPSSQHPAQIYREVVPDGRPDSGAQTFSDLFRQ